MMNLNRFNQSDFLQALKAFFGELKVPINYLDDKPTSAKEALEATYKDNDAFRLIDDVYLLGMVDDAAFKGLESLAIAKIKSDYDGILIFGVTLGNRENDLLPTRSQLAEISRAFNREFCYTPVVVVFKYANLNNQYLAFANTERLKYKQEWREGEKAGKVTLLRDINIRQPHSGHERILADLQIPITGKDRVDSFAKLYTYWQKALDVSLLNKKFYQEVSYWYLDACKRVVFPKDAKSNQDSLIRLITRIMFVWFLKEKGLVPDALFHKEDLQGILKSLESQESNYYKAILQNLFFATLNTEWGERRFRKKANKGRDQAYMIHNEFRYADAFVDAEKALADYFQQIPFLNGGLFECLDRRDENEPEVRIDGFSDRPDNILSIPNELFFGDSQDVDLNEDFGTSRKKYQIRGLIHIFNSYKFTIAENTPLEQDVALDPELLGQVFENLLAAYNPETQTTARKQTGSFYTPREIVNYMVDESLIAYFKHELLQEDVGFVEVGRSQTNIFGNEYRQGQLTIQQKLDQNPFLGKEDDLEQKLRQLLSFDDINPFTDDDKTQERLIRALDNCKILDPACGSGAFPMGILQKMVHILKKLDPRNDRWRHQQKEKAIAPLLKDIQFAEQISYEDAREKAINELQVRLKEIEASFENEMDYPRKLFLIQNCIYGVDIQAIAVQIAKLRCFISLIIDQREERDATNRGILPLPNLETKFVAANTLIKVSDQMSLRSAEVEVREQELKEVRQKHFTARTKRTKDKYRLRDRELRNAIGDLLKATGLESALADTLSRWNPYDQNTSADFFDPSWMFGITDGFDVVIGNPPYGVKFNKQNENELIGLFSYAKKVPDSYFFFVLKGLDLTKDNGNLTYIVPNTFCDLEKGDQFRKHLLTKYTLGEIFETGWAFESAVVDTLILFLSKSKIKNNIVKIKVDSQQYERLISDFLNDPLVKIDYRNSPSINNIRKTIFADSVPLSQIADVKAGVKMYEKGKGFPLQNDKLIEQQPYSVNGSCPEGWRILYRGKDINRYYLSSPSEFVDYGIHLAAPRSPELFQSPKILMRRTDDRLMSALEYDSAICVNSCHIIKLKDDFISKYSYRFLLGLLNSKLMQYIFEIENPQMIGKVFAEIKVVYVERLPIPIATELERKEIEELVQKCLDAKGQNVQQWEQEIDQIVARLYGLSEEEMKIIRGEKNE